jgi:hypothetical protein
MKKRRIILAGVLIMATGIAAMVLRSQSDIDLASEEPPFSAIVLPLKTMRGDIYMDGGSVWVGVEDSSGASYDFVFPYDHKTEGYPAAFHGAMEPYAPGAVPLSNPPRARTIVLNWLRESGRHDEGLERAFDYLSGQNDSIIRRVKRDGLVGIFK